MTESFQVYLHTVDMSKSNNKTGLTGALAFPFIGTGDILYMTPVLTLTLFSFVMPPWAKQNLYVGLGRANLTPILLSILQQLLSSFHLLPASKFFLIIAFSCSPLYIILFPSIKSVPSFPLLLLNLHPLSSELCWRYWVLGRGRGGSSGICSKGWRGARNRASLRQPESRCWIYLQPTCQLMLFVGVRQVGIASLAFTRPRCPREI